VEMSKEHLSNDEVCDHERTHLAIILLTANSSCNVSLSCSTSGGPKTMAQYS
jgi:hypothetical protein